MTNYLLLQIYMGENLCLPQHTTNLSKSFYIELANKDFTPQYADLQADRWRDIGPNVDDITGAILSDTLFNLRANILITRASSKRAGGNKSIAAGFRATVYAKTLLSRGGRQAGAGADETDIYKRPCAKQFANNTCSCHTHSRNPPLEPDLTSASPTSEPFKLRSEIKIDAP
ncbi:unnamed protein product [Colias eurytheme]|nr:unnamed protein product [Colias eurytheme]